MKRSIGTIAQALLESTVEGIYGIDLKGNCTLANAACVRMLGYRHETELLKLGVTTERLRPFHPGVEFRGRRFRITSKEGARAN